MRATRAHENQVDRRARAAVSALFLTNGALYANILPRYPEIKAAFGLDDSAYGFVVIAFPIGAIIAGLAAARVIRRIGSAKAAVFSTMLTSLAILAAGFAPSVWLFALALFLGGAMDAITDVAQNAHGLRVQRRYGRSILNSFHAVWSIGAVLGGAMAALAMSLQLPIGAHLSLSALLFSAAALTALRFCLPGRDEESSADAPGEVAEALRSGIGRRTVFLLVALVIIAMSGTVVEDAGFTWAALYLDDLGADASLLAAGLIALVGAQFVGRLIGDGLIDRFGQRAVARAGGLITACGMGLALAFPTIPGTILGFAAAGIGIATLVPAAMNGADELPGLAHGTGLTVVSWLMRLGFLLSPPVIGVISTATSLRLALLVVPIAGILVILLAGALSPARKRGR